MNVQGVRWVTRLEPLGDPIDPICDAELVALATAKLGPGPVAWAVEVANEIAHAHASAYPAFATSDPFLLSTRRGPESATLLTLITLVDGIAAPEPVRADARLMIQDYVHRRIPLEEFLQAVNVGYAWLNRALIEACERFVVLHQRMADTQLVLRLVSEFIQQFISSMVGEYAAELERWTATDVAVREALVRRVLSENEIDLDGVATKLGYRIGLRNHRAMILWAEGVGTASLGSLERFSDKLLDERGLTRRLMVPIGLSELWCWTDRPSSDQDDAAVRLALPAGVGMAAGQVHRGRNGFRRSHQEALAAKRVAQAGPWSSGRSVAYADASLASLLLDDPEAAADFVADELGDLAVPEGSIEALRQTLAVFLTCHSPSAAASELFVARNTVTYRLRRIEELLPRPMKGRDLELGAALRLLEVLPVTLVSEAMERRDGFKRERP